MFKIVKLLIICASQMHFLCNQLSKVIVICFLLGSIVLKNTKPSKNLEELKRQDKVNNADSVFVFLAILFISRNGQIQMAYMALTDKCILKIHVKM